MHMCVCVCVCKHQQIVTSGFPLFIDLSILSVCLPFVCGGYHTQGEFTISLIPCLQAKAAVSVSACQSVHDA